MTMLSAGPPNHPQLLLGTAPDSWGVWFADDPEQVPWTQFLDEAHYAGYSRVELGPYGFLPTDPARLLAELDQRRLTLTGGAVFAGLHRGAAALEEAMIDCDRECRLLTALGASYLVLLPEGYSDLDGRLTQPTELTTGQWNELTNGMNVLAKHLFEDWNVRLVVHPHADSHLGTQEQIVRVLEATDPEYVSLCLDTGHVTYCGGDSVAIVRQYPERIGYVHLKQVDPTIRQRVLDENLGFAPAVRLGAMVEPPNGEPQMVPLIAALAELDRELYCIVEQDMYPCALDRPFPIAARTWQYFVECGLAGGDTAVMGDPR